MKNGMQTPWRALWLLSAATGVWGHQASPVDVSVESVLAKRGASYLHLTNHTRESHTMGFSAGAAGTVEFRPVRGVVLSPGATMDVSLGELALGDGPQVLHVESTMELARGGTAAGPELQEVLEVSSTGIAKTSYEQAFLARRVEVRGASVPLRTDIGGGYIDAQPIGRLAFPSARESADTVVERVDEVSPFALSAMRLKELPEDGGAAGTGMAGLRTARLNEGVSEKQGGIFGTIQGKFMLKLPGGVKQAAWGWKVRAWQLIGGVWFQLAATSVTADGTWKADFQLQPFPGIPVRVEYQPANRFLQIQDAEGNVYTWADDWALEGSAMDIGYRSADLTKTGSAPGIDRIYQGGTALWRKFKKHGMNALRNEPIEITYPNKLSTGKCQTPSGSGNKAWSCSYSEDGKIWLIPQHATARVTQHELAHSIHSYYWDGNMPAGSGIPHAIDKCYNPGLALTEGFADFMPFWVQFEKTEVNPALNFNLETVPGGYCDGSSNEAHVAATFWDVYDTADDGTGVVADTWSFYHPYAPVSTFLKNPGHNSMFEYAGVYTAILGQDKAVPIVGLFMWNTMHLP
ncbi:MAG: hypothetical protein JNM66_27595 [Bryobacterales bacterium]|nr:hypothetical protein [Bryobacterales bacterium]